jgi:hypothetical protein
METRGAGGIAQLVEHLHGMQGVRSSNLLTSTTKLLEKTRSSAFDDNLAITERTLGQQFTREYLATRNSESKCVRDGPISRKR